ncbi:MAG TPA: glycosyltransferase [Acidimicrobiia bacterium]|jgi:glycosyltransferase involved in cell wall biosynthesis
MAATQAVVQLVPTWEPGAIGAHVLAVHETLAGAGVASRVLADDIRPGLPPIASDARALLDDPSPIAGTVLVYHAAMGTPMGDELLLRREPIVLAHHNMTPPEFFDAWDPGLAENLEVGERQVVRLARRSVLGIGDSSFNAEQLAAAGCPRTVTVPVFVPPLRAPSPQCVAELRAGGGGHDWLFVGRVAPNKCVHDLVAAFAAYRDIYAAGARLRVVGSTAMARYVTTVQRLAEHFGVSDAVELTGNVDDDTLAAHYSAADVFVGCSEHEGFGVPLVEAMSAGVPVVTFRAGAVAETVGAAAVVLDRKAPLTVAAAVARVLGDGELRDTIVAAGRRRAAELDREHTASKLLAELMPVLQTPNGRGR